MTEQEIIRAIAELDGYTDIELTDDGICGLKNGKRTGSLGCGLAYVPDYLTSRDAIVPVVEKQHYTIQNCVDINLKLNASRYTWLSTAPQLAEALLRATGKWKESN